MVNEWDQEMVGHRAARHLYYAESEHPLQWLWAWQMRDDALDRAYYWKWYHGR